MSGHQTIAITVTGLAELAHSEYQVRWILFSGFHAQTVNWLVLENIFWGPS